MNMPIAFQNAGVPAQTEELVKALGNVSAGGEGAQGFNGRELLRMDKGDGAWLFGQDCIEVGDDLIAINPASFQHGYISWGDGVVLGEKMVPITQAAPVRADLEDTGERWDEQLQFDAQTVTGDDTGVALIYKSTAHGGKEAIRTLSRQILAQMSNSPKFCVPVIKLSNSSYNHKKWGRIYKPIFEITSWIDFEGNAMPGTAKVAQEPKKAANDPKPEVPANESAEVAAEPAPPRSRRRSRRS